MNILGLVFSLILILTYGFFACWEKEYGSHRLSNTYLGHEKVNREILLKYERELYEKFRTKPTTTTETAKETSKKQDEENTSPKVPELNLGCARLNLMPLIKEGREEHPQLYELAAKVLRIFYSKSLFESKARFEYQFLDRFLNAAKIALKKETPFVLEKISFKDLKDQILYYKMLKGIKEWNLSNGCPTLLDYFQFKESEEDKICLFHAHPDFIAVLFGPKAAGKLFEEMHKKDAPPLTKEKIEQICSESHITLDPDLLELLQLGKPNHERDSKITLIETDDSTHISLRKNVFLNPS